MAACSAYTGEFVAECRGISLVEDQVQHGQHGIQATRELVSLRYLIGDPCLADLVLRPHDALRECGWRNEKAVSDLFGREPTQCPHGECDLGVGRQRGMAAGEDEAERVVGDFVTAIERRIGPRCDSDELARELRASLIQRSATP